MQRTSEGLVKFPAPRTWADHMVGKYGQEKAIERAQALRDSVEFRNNPPLLDWLDEALSEMKKSPTA